MFFGTAEPAARPGVETRGQLVDAQRQGAAIEFGGVAGLGELFQQPATLEVELSSLPRTGTCRYAEEPLRAS